MKRPAFTIVEVIAAITILGLISTIGASLMLRVAGAGADTAERLRLHTELCTALERIDRALREIAAKSDGSPDITSLSSTSITFNSTASISLSGTDLQFTEAGGSAAILLPGVTSLALVAYDQDNASLGSSLSGSSCASIRRIQVTITASGLGGITDTLRTKVFIRALSSGAGT